MSWSTAMAAQLASASLVEAPRCEKTRAFFMAPELQDCEEIVRFAVENDGYAIRSASERLRDHYDLAMLAITTYTDAYTYLSPRLQNHPEIIKLYLFKKEEENKWLPSKMR